MSEFKADRRSNGTFKAIPLEPGQKYNFLTVLCRLRKQGHNWVWSCLCDCGAKTEVLGSNIRSGNTKSCGCHKGQAISKAMTIHGKSGTRCHWLWQNMMRRCYDAKNPAFGNYGGRGITVCARWHEFETFYADMGERPAGHSLDRIENQFGYSLENCRWATRTDQARNTRANVMITRDGQTKTLAEWAELTGIPYSRLHARRRLGWGDEELFLGKRLPQRINGGQNGAADRQALYARALKVLA